MSTRMWPAVGCVIRNAGHGTHSHLERGVKRPIAFRFSNGPPGASMAWSGQCTSPPERGSTVTLALALPPGRGSLSHFGSAVTFMGRSA